MFIFLTSAREQLQHLLENTQLLYSLYCSLLTPTYWLSIRYIFKTRHCQSVLKLITISLTRKFLQKNRGFNNVHCKVRTDIVIVISTFISTQVRSTRSRNIFLFSANPSSYREPSVPARGLSLGNSSIFASIYVHNVDHLNVVESQSFP